MLHGVKIILEHLMAHFMSFMESMFAIQFKNFLFIKLIIVFYFCSSCEYKLASSINWQVNMKMENCEHDLTTCVKVKLKKPHQTSSIFKIFIFEKVLKMNFGTMTIVAKGKDITINGNKLDEHSGIVLEGKNVNFENTTYFI